MDQDAGRPWIVLVIVCLASTLGLAAAVLPLVEDRVPGPWPWAHTQRLLVVAFPLMVGAALVYLTQQERRAAALRCEILHARDRCAERMQRQAKRLSALLNVSRIMGSETNLQAVFDSVTRLCREAFGCQQVSLMLLEADTQELVVRSACGHPDPTRLVGARMKLGEGIAGWVAERDQALRLEPGAADPEQFPGLRCKDMPMAAAMVVPIRVRNELVGVLNVSAATPTASFDEADLQALQVFAENVGACIRHTEQAEWMRALLRRHHPQAFGAQSDPSGQGV